MPESQHPFLAEFRQTALSLLHGFLLVKACLGEKLVGIADQLLFKCLWQKTLMGEGKVLAYDVIERKSGSCMTLAHTGMTLKALAAQESSAQDAVSYVRLSAVAFYARRIGQEYPKVVKHRSLPHEVFVKTKFRA